MRNIQRKSATRGVALATLLVVSLVALAPANAEDVTIVTRVVPAEELADMLYVNQPLTRSIRKKKPTIAFMVQFEFDSAEILPESRPMLDALGRMLNLDKIAGKGLRIEGHTDSVGGQAYNRLLSERRARAVARYLERGHGVDVARLTISGAGEMRPLDGKDPSDGMNRRVQFQSAE